MRLRPLSRPAASSGSVVALSRLPGASAPTMSYLLLMVPEGKVGEPRTDDPESARRHNRLHFDIRVWAENHPEVVAQLIARGATKLWDGRQGPSTWVTMADPEGNEFCSPDFASGVAGPSGRMIAWTFAPKSRCLPEYQTSIVSPLTLVVVSVRRSVSNRFRRGSRGTSPRRRPAAGRCVRPGLRADRTVMASAM